MGLLRFCKPPHHLFQRMSNLTALSSIFPTLHLPVNLSVMCYVAVHYRFAMYCLFYVCHIEPTVTSTVTNVDGEQVKFSSSAYKCHHIAL